MTLWQKASSMDSHCDIPTSHQKQTIELVCGWETLGSSLAPHLIGNMNTHSSLAPS